MSKEIMVGYQVELFKYIASTFNIETLQNKQNIIEAANLIKAGSYPILVSNHQSHVDGIPHALIVKKLMMLSEGRLNGFYLPIAASIETGQQGHDLQKLIIDQKPLLSNLGLQLLPVTREKDNRIYAIPYNNESIKKIIRSPKDNFGFVFLPEGNVQGGRQNIETGNINGMSRPDSLGALDLVIRGCIKQNKLYFFLPVGIDGSYKIVSPDHSKNGNQIDDFKTEKIMNFINTQDKANINIGNPILAIDYDNFENKLDGLLYNVAKLLPVEAQGIYSHKNRVNLGQI